MRSNGRSLCHFGLVVLIGLVVTIGTQAQSASPSPSPSPTLEHEFFKNIVRDQKAIWTAPFRWNRSDTKWLVPLGLGTGALIATDRTTARSVARFDDQLTASRIISYPGSTYGAAAVGAMFYLAGRKAHDDRARETGLLSWEALVNSEIVVVSLKAITERRRPMQEHRGDFFRGGTSFPSGHAIHAWSVATVIANEYSDHRSVQVAAYGLAAAVSFARFTGEKHFLSDILVGSALGFGIGRYVYHAHHRSGSNSGGEEDLLEHDRHWPAVAPLFDSHAHSYGLGLTWSF